MICGCGNKLTCVDTRRVENNFVRRRYNCLSCGEKFSTVEHPITLQVMRQSSKKQMEIQNTKKANDAIKKVREFLSKLEVELES
jgi:transcriptional regulator NrdR family protein